ncbi:MAG TPA: histidine phosphatase family protein [Bacteroidales bacterium]|nr:histidine phosphatase family protein [Bacteroidales bacterium]
MLEVVVIRHGETEWNKERIFQGQKNSPLTEKGKKQAKELGKRLSGDTFNRIFASDLGRAWQTAELICAAGNHPSTESDIRIQERSFGIAEGKTYEELMSKHPDIFESLKKRDPEYAVPGGESPVELYERTVDFFTEKARGLYGKRILVVTHGGVLTMFTRYVLSIPLDQPRKFKLPNTGYNEFVFENGYWMIKTLGDVGHLKGELAEGMI